MQANMINFINLVESNNYYTHIEIFSQTIYYAYVISWKTDIGLHIIVGLNRLKGVKYRKTHTLKIQMLEGMLRNKHRGYYHQ